MKYSSTVAIAWLALFAISKTGVACAIFRIDFSPRTISAADIIFRGRIVDYQIDAHGIAKLRFDVTVTYRGETKDQWTLKWTAYSLGLPKTISEYKKYYGDDTVVAAATPSGSPIARIGEEVLKHPWVAQAPCAPPVMVRWNDGPQFQYFMELVRR